MSLFSSYKTFANLLNVQLAGLGTGNAACLNAQILQLINISANLNSPFIHGVAFG